MWVVVDTNKLPRNSAKGSAAFERLCQLSEGGHVSIALPEPILQEWKTQTEDQVHSQAEKAQDSIKKLLTGGNLADAPQFDPLGVVLPELETVRVNAVQLAEQSKNRLIERLNAHVRPIAPDHGKRVSDAYFAGSPPFSSKKNRNDFPDALIYESVVDLANENPEQAIVVVTADKNLAKHLSALPNVEVYESLEELITSPNLEQIVAAIEAENEWHAQFEDVVDDVVNIQDQILGDEFTSTFIEHMFNSIVHHLSIPSDYNDAYVSMIDDPENTELNWDEAEDYGPGRIRVPFSCTSEVLLDFSVFYADAYGLADHIGVQYSDPEENPFFQAQANATANVSGYALVSIAPPMDAQALTDAVISVDEITSIELEEDETGDALN